MFSVILVYAVSKLGKIVHFIPYGLIIVGAGLLSVNSKSYDWIWLSLLVFATVAGLHIGTYVDMRKSSRP